MNKIVIGICIKTISVLTFVIITSKIYAQDSALNKYGLYVISSGQAYLACVNDDPGKEMVDLKKYIPGLVIDLKYAGTNNFMKKKLYRAANTTYLRKPVAMALALVQIDLNKQGLGLKIFDAYRPYAVTEKMWELVNDDRYAANPKNGSGHNRGIAVDLTITNLLTKRPLNMGTEFDNFTDTAHHNFTGLSNEIIQNRLLLKNIMEKNGFKALETEWWHYSFPNAAAYELLDINFRELKKRIK